MKTINNALVWNPLEIKLVSTKKYENPYLDVEINATFKHVSGKEINVMGFWHSEDIFAVRFTPSLEGTWEYDITCTDKDNKDLFLKGSFVAKKEESELLARKHGFVTDRHNNRYFTYDDGTPFYWLADTHWQAPNYETIFDCNYPGCDCKNQFKHEVDDRLKKGFTVYQTYFDASESDGGGQAGLLPSLWDKKFTKPSSEFANKVDVMFEYLDSVGMAIALGFGVHYITVQNMDEQDLFRFAKYIIARYGCYNIIWIIAQEITRLRPSRIEGKTVFDTYLELGQLVRDYDGYKHPVSAHMDVMEFADERAKRLSDQPWHTYWMTQGGHGEAMVPKKKHYKEYAEAKDYFKPVIEGELNYEDLNCGYFADNRGARVSAWNAMFAGCAGYTYGATGIWANGYSTEISKGWLGEKTSYSYEPWYMGLSKPGSFEMQYLKEFFMNIKDWYNFVPSYYDTSLGDFLEDENKLMMRIKDDTVACYFRNTDLTTGKVLQLNKNKTYTAYWFDVRTGNYIKIDTISGVTEYDIPQKPALDDWAFILTAQELKNITVVEKFENKTIITGEVIAPKNVSAIGGIYYKDGKLIDNTEYLYDGKKETVWIPFAQRSTQTIIYDLGKQYELGGVEIVPNENTALPPYRVEVSNDGQKWFTQADTNSQGAKFHKGKVTSKITGTWQFVKIMLHNKYVISEKEAEEADYKVFVNTIYVDRGNKPTHYAETQIREISVYGKN